MRQPFSALVYPVRLTDSGWEYLLLRRIAIPDIALPSFWQGITGGLEEGESITQTAIRELAEETHFVSHEIVQIDFSYSYPIRDEWRKQYGSGPKEIVEYVFIAFVDGHQSPRLSEHDDWRWCTVEQSLKMLKWPENIEALKYCEEYLKSCHDVK